MNDKKVYYYCDRKACEVCSNPDCDSGGCNHTSDINHAMNFARDHGNMVESVTKAFNIPPAVLGFMMGNEDYKKQFDAYLDSFTVHPGQNKTHFNFR